MRAMSGSVLHRRWQSVEEHHPHELEAARVGERLQGPPYKSQGLHIDTVTLEMARLRSSLLPKVAGQASEAALRLAFSRQPCCISHRAGEPHANPPSDMRTYINVRRGFPIIGRSATTAIQTKRGPKMADGATKTPPMCAFGDHIDSYRNLTSTKSRCWSAFQTSQTTSLVGHEFRNSRCSRPIIARGHRTLGESHWLALGRWH